MTNDELKKVLEMHQHWLDEDCEGWEDMKADLYEANLYGADLRGADLRGAILYGADLRGADLRGANLLIPLACPPEGAFTAWKKCSGGVVAKLLIPENAKRSSATGRKCRASEAVVVALYGKGGEEVSEARSQHDYSFVYRPGETVTPKEPFDESRWNECASGIHFFITREEAEAY